MCDRKEADALREHLLFHLAEPLRYSLKKMNTLLVERHRDLSEMPETPFGLNLRRFLI